MKKINTNEVFQLQPDGSTILIRVEEVEIDVPDPEDIIKQKQDEILRIYEEILRLKNQNL